MAQFKGEMAGLEELCEDVAQQETNFIRILVNDESRVP